MAQGSPSNRMLADSYLEKLPYRDVDNPRVFLIFSGMPGSGKTFLAQKFAKDLRAQYIRHDDIRDEVKHLNLDLTKFHIPSVSKLIINDIMAHDRNKFIILDGSIDHGAERYFEHVKELHALPIIIRFDVPIETILERIVARDKNKEALLAETSHYRTAFENSRENIDADLTLGEHYDYGSVLNSVGSLISRAYSK
jgi:predicted kinase